MDTAIVYTNRDAQEISADEFYALHGLGVDSNIRIECPECGQPVRACAMHHHNIVRPYFRHLSDDPTSQDCPLYADGWRYYYHSSGARRFTNTLLPLEIEALVNDLFELCVTIPPIGSNDMSALTSMQAHLYAGTTSHRITRKDFPEGTQVLVSYGIKGDSFGDGLRVGNKYGPYKRPIPYIQRPKRGALLFQFNPYEGHGTQFVGEPIHFDYWPHEFLLACSISQGRQALRDVKREALEFDDVGTILGSNEKIRVARVVFVSDHPSEFSFNVRRHFV